MFVALCAPTVVAAQDIVELNEQGIEAFKAGRFDEAAQKFNEAYAIKPEPPLKKNEALAWFKAGQCDQALTAANEYLGLGVDDELSSKEAQTVVVRCQIQKAEAMLAAGDADGAEAALAPAKAGAPTEADQQEIARVEASIQAKRDADEQARQAMIAAAEAEKAAQAAEEKREQRQLVGLGVASAGGAIVLGTLIYHIALATGTSKKFQDAAARGDQAEYDRLGKKLETGNWLVPTLYGVGLATSGVGVYLWWSARAEEPAPAATQPAAVGLESLGITATVRF